ncbi:MAG: HD domain-containing protein [Bacteroidota bacterium]
MIRVTGSEHFWKALEFATEHHKFQRRKGYNRVPYINHPVKVAALLAQFGEMDTVILCAALLHDVLEDTPATSDQLTGLFGEEICSIVLELTDDMSLPKYRRKKLQVEHAPFLSEKAKKIKIADKTSNMSDLISYPINWSVERKAEYFLWAARVVEGCRGVNAGLEARFDETYLKGLKEFGLSH